MTASRSETSAVLTPDRRSSSLLPNAGRGASVTVWISQIRLHPLPTLCTSISLELEWLRCQGRRRLPWRVRRPLDLCPSPSMSSVERILSGEGLEKPHRTVDELAGRAAAPLTGAQISAAALRNERVRMRP